MQRLTRSFFAQPTLIVAEKLLGKILVKGECSGRIIEVEAYIGEDDPACHACHGQTPRNAPMFGPPGFSYVYFIYGMYFCLNIVTEKKGFPAAVLIRGIEPICGIELMKKRRGRAKNLADGPGKLCNAFSITRADNNLDLICEKDFFVADDGVKISAIQKTSRIGIREGGDKLWRFVVSKNQELRIRNQELRIKNSCAGAGVPCAGAGVP